MRPKSERARARRDMRAPLHVLGGGSLGSLFAAHLRRVGPTTLLLRSAEKGSQCDIEVMRGEWAAECGLAISESSAVGLEASDGGGEPIAFLMLATKAFAARSALDGVKARLTPQSTVVLLCNGALAVADELSMPEGCVPLFATTTHGAWRCTDTEQRKAGADGRHSRVVHHAGNGSTWVGTLPLSEAREADGASFRTAEVVAAAVASIDSAGLRAVAESPAQTERRLWLKLAANAVLNPLTT